MVEKLDSTPAHRGLLARVGRKDWAEKQGKKHGGYFLVPYDLPLIRLS
jgi:hypothetical protein